MLVYPGILIKLLRYIGLNMKKVMCKKLKKEAEALDYLPYPGEIGKKIQENISKEG